ncbi:hypothetical protein GLP22_15395 [Photobacterium carnosum]|uniref:conjugal transfer protein TraF n=1 Tax=Photobacterium carnosum TaxID=2023717 RepID=UPI001E416D82|nr:conjugal transfer protein TraF [Photobacterium carnosum]MCD9542574.1 hypothetical protein [Photobacterium carnosum]
MKIKPVLLAVIACMATCNAITATANTYGHGDSFYNKKDQGWFWYEPEQKPAPKPKPKKPKPKKDVVIENNSKPTTKNVQITVKWLRDNIPRLRDEAIDYPTYENVQRYMYAQRLMLDKASKFSSVSMEVSKLDPTLNEELRRPGHQNALIQYGDQRRTASYQALKEISKKVGIFFFFKSTCQYCHQQAPILYKLQQQTGLQVLPISVDGKMIPGNPWKDYFVTDTYGKLTQKLHVMVYPTMYLVTKDGSKMINVAAGLTSFYELANRIIVIGKQQKWISQVDYQKAQHVREIELVKDPNKPITLDENKIYNDPKYLSKQLKKQFEERYSGKERGELAFGGDAK